jgi:YD repeat-containing protein
MPSTASSSPQNPLAATTCFGYDDSRNGVTLVAPGREVTYYGYGSLDRLALVRADALGLDAATYYLYDPAGNRTCLIDPESHPTYLSYDPLGRLASERDALGKSEYYGYDAVANLLWREHRTAGIILVGPRPGKGPARPK